MTSSSQNQNIVTRTLTSISTAVKIVLSIVTVISSVVAWTVYIDSRYAHASDVQRQQEEIVKELRRNFLQMRLEVVKDRIEELKMKKEQEGSLSPYEKVHLEELENRRQNLILQLNAIQ